MRMRNLKRRFQQLFIVSAVIGAGSVVACSAIQRGVTVENQLDYPVQLTIGSLNSGNSNSDIDQIDQYARTIGPDEKVIFEVDSPGGPNSDRAAVKLADNDGNVWRFWASKKSVERAGCVVQITEELIDYLNENYEKTRVDSRSKLVIRDSELLRPLEVGGSACDLTPWAATQTAAADYRSTETATPR